MRSRGNQRRSAPAAKESGLRGINDFYTRRVAEEAKAFELAASRRETRARKVTAIVVVVPVVMAFFAVADIGVDVFGLMFLLVLCLVFLGIRWLIMRIVGGVGSVAYRNFMVDRACEYLDLILDRRAESFPRRALEALRIAEFAERSHRKDPTTHNHLSPRVGGVGFHTCDCSLSSYGRGGPYWLLLASVAIELDTLCEVSISTDKSWRKLASSHMGKPLLRFRGYREGQPGKGVRFDVFSTSAESRHLVTDRFMDELMLLHYEARGGQLLGRDLTVVLSEDSLFLMSDVDNGIQTIPVFASGQDHRENLVQYIDYLLRRLALIARLRRISQSLWTVNPSDTH